MCPMKLCSLVNLLYIFLLLVFISCTPYLRYGIPPSMLGQALMADSKVKAYVVFIASLGSEAERCVYALIILYFFAFVSF